MASATAAACHDTERPASGRLRRRRWRAAVCTVLIIALTCAAFGVWRWQRGLALFETTGNVLSGQLPVDKTRYILIAYADVKHTPVTIDVRSASPRVTLNSADASVQVIQCVGNGHIVVGGPVRHLSFCSGAHAFSPGPLRFTGGLHSAVFAVKIDAHRPGLVRIHGLRVTYRHGIRTGTQDTGINLEFRASTSSS